MQFLFAPVQGHTDAAYRHFHSKIYGGGLTYYSPFLRLEKNELRPRDVKDLTSYLNSNHHLIPQIIFRDKEELLRLTDILIKLGAKEIDLNMGCPFPLQTGHKRGAATIANEALGIQVKNLVNSTPEVNFSVKIRLGLNNKDDWHILLPILNETTLTHITLHPRIARQQYGGAPDLVEFGKFLSESTNPVIYNGDLKTPEDIFDVQKKFPGIHGVMIGRGLLGRPTLFNEFQYGKDMEPKERLTLMLKFHNELFRHYSEVLCGKTQIISKIQPFWEYAGEEIGRKAWKTIKKASNLAKYQSAIAMIQNSII